MICPQSGKPSLHPLEDVSGPRHWQQIGRQQAIGAAAVSAGPACICGLFVLRDIGEPTIYLAAMTKPARTLPQSIDETQSLLGEANYLADRSLATVLFLTLRMGRPIFLEGEAGVGKTEIAKVLATTLGRRLIRLQCYEGLDVSSAVYEWNYADQMIAIRLAEAVGNV